MKRQTKPCKICGEPIPWATGDYPKRYENKQYCSRSCANRARRQWDSTTAYNRWYAERHKEKLRKRKAKWYQDHKEKEKRRNAQWRKEHPDYHSTWKREHSDECRIYEHNRRARLSENGGAFTKEEWQQALEQHNHRCAVCGVRDSESSLTIDHIVPISKGGSNDISNIQPLCSTCNCEKAAKLPD